ncbi:SAM-dependent methyltransferase [Alteromonas sp. ASW11-36]|uniref:tRNA (guanine(46)-N(7))-methyltransferase n=2 Tax=Alteromonas arenosi TaxID=3055817 RepID=A0ABT7SYL8_9ALTE|nr:methyltransferase domain-containing protein [Alteromonas sp. ASW11-36]MDM7861278.1 SAM-dependent methyltransferase [Alteromonas sp. ASW11-36]
MSYSVRPINTTQTEVHDKLEEYVKRYQQAPRRRPVSEHTQLAFDAAIEWLGDWQGPIIFDSCCGVGESTAVIAAQYPDAKVIGIDKSAARLAKHTSYTNASSNYQVIRADVNDFWYLAQQHGIKLSHHFLLYPNPYPKPGQIQKRWHAGPAMPDFIALGGTIEVRSNWRLLLEEFRLALIIYGIESELTAVSGEPMTPFERKYLLSGQDCWRLVTQHRM